MGQKDIDQWTKANEKRQMDKYKWKKTNGQRQTDKDKWTKANERRQMDGAMTNGQGQWQMDKDI